MSFRNGGDEYLPDVLLSLFPSLEERAYLDDLIADRRAEVAENFYSSGDAPVPARARTETTPFGGSAPGQHCSHASRAGRAHLDDEPEKHTHVTIHGHIPPGDAYESVGTLAAYYEDDQPWTFTQKVALTLLLVLVAWAVLACLGGLLLLLLGALS